MYIPNITKQSAIGEILINTQIIEYCIEVLVTTVKKDDNYKIHIKENCKKLNLKILDESLSSINNHDVKIYLGQLKDMFKAISEIKDIEKMFSNFNHKRFENFVNSRNLVVHHYIKKVQFYLNSQNFLNEVLIESDFFRKYFYALISLIVGNDCDTNKINFSNNSEKINYLNRLKVLHDSLKVFNQVINKNN